MNKYSRGIYIVSTLLAGTLAEEIKVQHHKNIHPKGVKRVCTAYPKCVKRVCTALDSLQSVERKEHEGSDMSSDLYSEADDILEGPNNGTSSDSSGNGTRFSKCTGIFSLDFPPSPKVSKGKGKKSWPLVQHKQEDTDSDVTTDMPTQT